MALVAIIEILIVSCNNLVFFLGGVASLELTGLCFHPVQKGTGP